MSSSRKPNHSRHPLPFHLSFALFPLTLNTSLLTLLLLVFGAVAALGYVVVSTLMTAAAERISLAGRDEGNVSVLRKVVSQERMSSLRMSSGFLAGILLFVLFSLLNFPLLGALLFSIAGGTVVSFLPIVVVRRKVASRIALFQSQILELTNGIAAGMRAGQSFPAALDSVSRRIAWPMSEELQTVIRENRLGLDMTDALARLQERLPSEDLALIVGAVRLTTKSGGSLAEVMERMTELIRARNDFQERLKNLTAQGKFEAVAMSLMPLVVFAILFFENRPLVMPLVTTTVGWTAICGVALLVLCGYLCIRRIVTIEV